MPKRKASDQAEWITPVRVRKAPESTPKPQRPAVRPLWIFLPAVMLMLAAGGWLLHYLRQNPLVTAPEPPASTVVEPPPAEPAKQPAGNPANRAALEAAAEEALAGFVKARQKIDSMEAGKWAGEAYEEMARLASEADRLLLETSYAAAAENYRAAASVATDIDARSGPAFDRLMREAEAAFEAGDGPGAAALAATALAISPESGPAQKLLNRSQNLPAVMALLAAGRRHEADDNLPAARDSYREALRTDPASESARSGAARVNEKLAARQFQKLMASGLTALHEGDPEAARKHLLQARKLRPEAGQVEDALTQAEQAIRIKRIQALQQQAEAAERAEDWQQALLNYQAVLDIDPNVQFAVEGRARAEQRIQIRRRLEFFIQSPDTLTSDQQLQNAADLLREAKGLQPAGPQLAARTGELARWVALMQTKVSVTIESDNLTEVAVYRVGRLGRFTERELHLRPGTYTMVGSRDGYRDIRREIQVKPGQEAIRVRIACKVKV
jgi:hypothetical protein